VFVLSHLLPKNYRGEVIPDTAERRTGNGANAQNEIRRRYSLRPVMSGGKRFTERGNTGSCPFFREYMSRFQLFPDKIPSPGRKSGEEFFTD
jgi:hypothetical protein